MPRLLCADRLPGNMCGWLGSEFAFQFEGDETRSAPCSTVTIQRRVLGHQLTIGGLNEWDLLPSPKLKPSDNVGVYSWAPRYAAFSQGFARAAIDLMGRDRTRPVLLDCFVGGGTSLIAAAELGIRAVGIDLDPFAALISRARVATKADSKRVQDLLTFRRTSQRQCCSYSDLADAFFSTADLDFASSVMSRVCDAVESHPSAPWGRLLQDSGGALDSEAVALAAICMAAMSAAKIVRGSNPVWVRRALPGEVGRRPRIETNARRLSRTMLTDLGRLPLRASARDVRVLNEDFRHPPSSDASFDLLLTSPPYLNRLDYVVNHLAPLVLLSGMIPVDVDDLRRKMIGTTKIVDRVTPNAEWGRTCQELLDAIASHKSKASATYYLWNYTAYFRDMFRTLQLLKALARPHAVGALVVQNSFYKELVVPTPKIVAEMAQSIGIGAHIVRAETVRSHIGTMSPRQTLYVKRKILEESVVLISFS